MCYLRGLNSHSRLSILLTWSPNVSKHLCVDFKHRVVGAFTKLFFIPHVFPHCPVHHSMEKDFSSGVMTVDGPPACLTSHPLALILRDEFSSLEPDGQWSTTRLCRMHRCESVSLYQLFILHKKREKIITGLFSFIVSVNYRTVFNISIYNIELPQLYALCYKSTIRRSYLLI